MYKTILFDLDGTLTESDEGITKCVQYALDKLGKPEPDLDKLKVFIGPPLMEQFQKYADLDEKTANKAVEYYRERYSVTGIFENKLYPDVERVLLELKNRGYILAVASSKPENYVRQILDYFNLTQYFDEICGSDMNGSRTNKTEVIEETLSRLNMKKRRDEVVMVGDREHDVNGAKKAGVACVAVSYGYGSKKELTEAGALKIIDSANELLDFFCLIPRKKTGPLKCAWRVIYPCVMHFMISLVFIGGCRALIEIISGSNESYYNYAIFVTALTGVVVMPICVWLYKCDRHSRVRYGIVSSTEKYRLKIYEMLVLLGMGAALSQYVNIIVQKLIDMGSYSENMSQLIDGKSVWFLLICTGIIAPIAEEMIFRWLIYLRLRDYFNKWTAIIISSLIFGIYHANLVQGVYAFILGVIFAYVFETTGSLWGSILLHMGANIWSTTSSDLYMWLYTRNSGIIISIMIILMVIFVLGMWHFVSKNKNRLVRAL